MSAKPLMASPISNMTRSRPQRVRQKALRP